MIPKSRFFQAKFPTAALAIALLVQISPAHSEMIDLTCSNTNPEPSSNLNIRIQIDTARKTVTEIWKDGKKYEFGATLLSDQFIKYVPQAEEGDAVGVDVTLDRIAGTLAFDTVWKGKTVGTKLYTCRRATQKF